MTPRNDYKIVRALPPDPQKRTSSVAQQGSTTTHNYKISTTCSGYLFNVYIN